LSKKYDKHIAVNTRLLMKGKLEGIGWFSYEVLRRLVRDMPDVHFSFFFDRPYDPDYLFGPNVTPYVIPPQARHPLLWFLWFHVQLRAKLNKLKPDVFFSPEFYLTAHPTIPQISTIHDLAYEHFPEDLPRFASWYVRRFSPLYARRADHIVTVSEFSRDDIVKLYGIPEEKISVVYNGCNERFRPVGEAEQAATRAKYTEGKPYFHFVGAIHPRKNIESLLLAFDRFKTLQGSDARLLIVGRKGWRYEGALQTFEQMTHKSDVVFTGYISGDALNRIYAASLGLVYVPYLEGFGIPVLEALYAETPVICSNVTSIPEVCGAAALQVDPFDIEAIAKAMQRLYASPALREALIEEGRLQRAKFSWDKSAKQIREILERFW
jgi:glycosyltransferase involved in cell wall biosynthesis